MQIWDVPKELVPAGHCSEILPLAAGEQLAAACCSARARRAGAFCRSGCLVSFFLLAPSLHPVLGSLCLQAQHRGSHLLGSDHGAKPSTGTRGRGPCGHPALWSHLWDTHQVMNAEGTRWWVRVVPTRTQVAPVGHST